jgi:hypothetical protein
LEVEVRVPSCRPLVLVLALVALLLAGCEEPEWTVPEPTPVTVIRSPRPEPTRGPLGPLVFPAPLIEGETGPETLSLLVTSWEFHPGFPSDRFPTRIDRVQMGASGEIEVRVLLRAADLGTSSFRVASDSRGQRIVVTFCQVGECSGFGDAAPDARTSVHRSLDGGETWEQLDDIVGAFVLPMGFVEDEALLSVVRPESRQYVLHPSGRAQGDPTGGAEPPLMVDDEHGLLWLTSDRRGLQDQARSAVYQLRLLDAVISKAAPVGDEEAVYFTWWNPAEPNEVFGALFGLGRPTQSTVLQVPAECCPLAPDRRHVLVPAMPMPAEFVEAYSATLPALPDGRPFARMLPAYLDVDSSTLRLITDPFAGEAYRDRDGIWVIGAGLPTVVEGR